MTTSPSCIAVAPTSGTSILSKLVHTNGPLVPRLFRLVDEMQAWCRPKLVPRGCETTVVESTSTSVSISDSGIAFGPAGSSSEEAAACKHLLDHDLPLKQSLGITG